MESDTVETQHGNLSKFLLNSRFEVIPLKNLQRQLEGFPQGVDVTVTCSPNKGIEKTLELSQQLTELNLNLRVIPHIASRMVRDEKHLDEILKKLEELNLTDVFFPGGDIQEPVGKFTSSLEVLQALSKKEHTIERIGITGYPEGHPLIETQTLYEALEEKQKYADYLVTQMCFDHEAILNWLRDLRARGVELPAYIGIPGAVERKKLLEISLKLGIGQSVSFLRKNMSFVKSFFGSGGLASTTDDLLKDFLPACVKEDLNVKGFHVYTFNQIGSTFEWWQKKISSVKQGKLTS